MHKGKRLLAIALASVMCFSMAACGNKTDNDGAVDADSQDTATEEGNGEEKGDNLIANGDFSAGLEGWYIYLETGAAEQLVTADGEMQIKVSDPGTKEHAVQPYYDGFALYQGAVYEYSFDVHSDIERTMQWRLQLNGGDYHAYVSDIITVNEEVQHVTCTFTMEEATDPAPRLCVNMGAVEGCPDGMGEHSVYFDNFELYLVDDSGANMSSDSSYGVPINVNQVGYLTNASKQAVVRSADAVSGDFDVVNVETNEAVYTGTLTDSKENKDSGEQTAIADFSSVTEPGTYKLVTENYGESYEFVIGDSVYDDVTNSAFHMFYLQRCGEAVEDSTYGHEACHTGNAVIYGTDSAIESMTGGWHDAGDYGRYVVAGAKAAADLMLTYETYGDVFGDATGIPESGNGTPDILDEVKYELDWMLQMQNSEGGVYHKITCENFPGTVMPEEETEQLVISPVSATATADFAATMAMAARIYKNTDATYANTCLDAAKKAYDYLENNEIDPAGFKNPSSVSTGEYPDTDASDELFWMNAEFYKTTGDAQYLDAMKTYDLTADAGLGWQNVNVYGMYTFLTCEGEKAKSDNYYNTVEKRLIEIADLCVQNAKEDAYQVTIGSDGYVWGSNMSVANNGMILLMANEIAQNSEYVDIAGKQLDYIMGTNTNSYCFITGFGTCSPVGTHHRPSQAVGSTMAGMLVGGPNSNLEDPYAAGTLADRPAAACYVDNEQSYSCNEITIYWNSPLVYLLTGINQEK